MIQQRDLLLVPFPFSDQTGKKVRPVIVISNEAFNTHSKDVLVVGVTSNTARDKYTLRLTNNDLETGTLITQSSIKVSNILKLDKELILKRIGTIRKETHRKIIKTVIEICK